jgi:hypothetical protein
VKPAQVTRYRIQIGNPSVTGKRVGKNALHSVRKLAVRSSEQRGGPSVVGVAHTSEPVHRNHQVNVVEEPPQGR